MIDVESDVFNLVRSAILAEYPKCYIVDTVLSSPPSYPCVFLVESDNTSYRKTADSHSNENHVALMYTLEVYSNKVGGTKNGKVIPGKKAECKAIAAIADNVFLNLGFERTLLQQIPNLNDATIFRMVGRYEAVASKDHVIYRR